MWFVLDYKMWKNFYYVIEENEVFRCVVYRDIPVSHAGMRMEFVNYVSEIFFLCSRTMIGIACFGKFINNFVSVFFWEIMKIGKILLLVLETE